MKAFLGRYDAKLLIVVFDGPFCFREKTSSYEPPQKSHPTRLKDGTCAWC